MTGIVRCFALAAVLSLCSVVVAQDAPPEATTTTAPYEVVQEQFPSELPGLTMSVTWSEQKLPNNNIHKLRIPRGGTVEVQAVIDPAGLNLGECEVALSASAGEVLSVSVNGEAHKVQPKLMVAVADKTVVRWTIRMPWELRQGEREYLFGVSATPRRRSRESVPGFDAPMKAAKVIEPTVSCWETTTKARIDEIAKSEFVKLETIGTTGRGRQMYLMRITDWSVPADKKKQLILIGPYHGNEPTGTETCLDLSMELVSDESRREWLKQFEFFVIPSHHPDARESGSHYGRYAIDPGNHSYAKLAIPEAAIMAQTLRKYKDSFTDPFAIVFHQWGRDYTLISHMDIKPADEAQSWTLIKNMCTDVSNQLDIPMYPTYSPYLQKTFTGIRGMLAAELGIANYTLENPVVSSFSLGLQMPLIQRELVICRTTIDHLAKPRDVAPKARQTPADLKFEPGQIFNVISAEKAPTIEGKLDDACWQGQTTIADYRPVTRGYGRPSGDQEPQARPDNRAWLAVDGENLYVAFKAPGLGQAKGDGVELMLDTNLDRWSYFHFMIFADGKVVGAYYVSPGMRSEVKELPGVKTVVSTEDGAVEMVIPLATLKGWQGIGEGAFKAPGQGVRWGANFLRMPYARVPEMSWAPLTNANSHRPWEFNVVVFGDK